jgi:catechol 2,3-dioxygenase-like lactoylglutathione lyase family enzyme
VGGLLQGRFLLLTSLFLPDISSFIETMSTLKPHVSLNVTNIDASVAFYEKAFGVPATKRRPGYAKFDLAEPALNLTMQEAPRTGVNASHFGVQVETSEDVARAKRRFEAVGLATFVEDDVTCCYALQDKVWIEDPDGNAWETFVVKADANVMRATSADASATRAATKDDAACCAPGACGPSRADGRS